MRKVLFTKSIIGEKELCDGRRISIMSRHTKEDGVTPDKKIVKGISFDEWRKEFAPPDKLVGAYYRNEIQWEGFEKKYIEYLQNNILMQKVKDFAKRCIKERITLLCIESNSDRCHRRLLAEELQKHESSLKIIHK